VCIYNDAHRPILGTKHPWALGRPVSEVWEEIWPVLQPLIDTPFHGGPATWNDDILLEINRAGFLEETHFAIAYSAVPDEAVGGGVGGVLATVHEITGKVLADRRVAVLRDLATHAVDAKTASAACEIAARTLGRHPSDFPFACCISCRPTDGRRSLSPRRGWRVARRLFRPASLCRTANRARSHGRLSKRWSRGAADGDGARGAFWWPGASGTVGRSARHGRRAPNRISAASSSGGTFGGRNQFTSRSGRRLPGLSEPGVVAPDSI
jgi:hypothetical protein